MKKFLSLTLAVLMLMCMAAVVSAEDVASGDITGGNTGDVIVNVDSTASGATVYHVEIVWGNLTFTYIANAWNTETYSYEGTYNDNGEATVRVINHSNASVNISAKFGSSDTITTDGVTATLSGNVFALASAATEGKAVENSFKLKLTGTPTADKIEVGTITVTISK